MAEYEYEVCVFKLVGLTGFRSRLRCGLNPINKGNSKNKVKVFVCFVNFKGHVVKNWKTRWFIVQHDMMFYFKSKGVRLIFLPLRSLS